MTFKKLTKRIQKTTRQYNVRLIPFTQKRDRCNNEDKDRRHNNVTSIGGLLTFYDYLRRL